MYTINWSEKTREQSAKAILCPQTILCSHSELNTSVPLGTCPFKWTFPRRRSRWLPPCNNQGWWVCAVRPLGPFSMEAPFKVCIRWAAGWWLKCPPMRVYLLKTPSRALLKQFQSSLFPPPVWIPASTMLFDYCSLQCHLRSERVIPLTLFFLLMTAVASGVFFFHINLRTFWFYFCKKCHWDFNRDGIESVDGFG